MVSLPLTPLYDKIGQEFMPPLNEGDLLFMPVLLAGASVDQVMTVMVKQDSIISSFPEVEMVVGKLGRAETATDPAPVSMIETVITYKSQYLVNDKGKRLRYRFDPGETDFFRDVEGNPLPGPDGNSS